MRWRTALGLTLVCASILDAQKSSVALELALGQTDAPVRVVGLTASASFLVQSVRAENRSGKDVLSVQFAGIVRAQDGSRRVLGFVEGDPVRVPLAAGQTGEVVAQFAPPKEMQDLAVLAKEPTAALEVGVVKVRFGDGSTWTHDLVGAGGFAPVPKP